MHVFKTDHLQYLYSWHGRFAIQPRHSLTTLQENTATVAKRLIPSKFSPIPHSWIILLPLDSTDASHKQINERQCSVTQITKWPAKLVTQYVYVTVATDSSERRGQTSSTSTRIPSIRFPSRTGEQLLLLFIVISWFPPRKWYYKYRHGTENTAIPKYAALVPQNIVTARQNTAKILKIPPQDFKIPPQYLKLLPKYLKLPPQYLKIPPRYLTIQLQCLKPATVHKNTAKVITNTATAPQNTNTSSQNTATVPPTNALVPQNSVYLKIPAQVKHAAMVPRHNIRVLKNSVTVPQNTARVPWNVTTVSFHILSFDAMLSALLTVR